MPTYLPGAGYLMRVKEQNTLKKMNNTSTLMWGLIFRSTGLAFFVYGKKAVIPLFSGI